MRNQYIQGNPKNKFYQDDKYFNFESFNNINKINNFLKLNILNTHASMKKKKQFNKKVFYEKAVVQNYHAPFSMKRVFEKSRTSKTWNDCKNSAISV